MEIPSTALATGKVRSFNEQTVPAAILSEHSTGPGRWAKLTVESGSLSFVDLSGGSRSAELAAGDQHIIAPEAPHRLELHGAVEFTLRFYAEPS